MRDVDPARVRVVCVGLETYRNPIFLPLTGAAATATRLAEWAVSCGVPEASVSLACTWAQTQDQRPERATFDALRDNGVDVLDNGDLATLEQLFTNASTDSGDLFLLYWAGHGVLSGAYERVVFAANTDENVNRYLNVANIQHFLRGSTGFASQMLFIDACANFANETDLRGPFDRHGLTPGPQQLDVPQWTLFSAAQGAYGNNAADQKTTFSGILLDWLRTNRSISIDFDQAVAHMSTQMRELSARAVARGFPVVHVLNSPTVDRKVTPYGGEPVSGAEKRAADAIALTIRQVRALERLALDNGVAADDLHDALLNALDVDPANDTRTTRELIAHVVGRSRRRRVLTSLAAEMPRESLQVLRSAWERHEVVARFLTPLGRVTQDEMRDAFYRVVPEATSMPPDLDAALGQAADFGEQILVQFVVALEHATGRRLSVEAYGDLADEPEIERTRSQLARRPSSQARLVISLPVDAARTWPKEVAAYIRPPNAPFQPAQVETCRPTEQGVMAVVQKRVAEMRENFGQFSVGFLVSRRVMEEATPEAWQVHPTAYDPGGPIWHLWPTCLHLAERRARKVWVDAWSEAVQRIKVDVDANVPRILWIDDGGPGRANDGSTMHLHAFRQRLASRQLGGDSLSRSADLGAPYVFWANEPPEDWTDTVALLRKVVDAGRFAEIPDRLLRERQGGGLAENLRMLWDDPVVLPDSATLLT